MKIYFLLIIISVFALGYYAGYDSRDSQGWDISKDPRACFIEWDDGTYSYKPRAYNIGTIGPGESITIPDNIEIKIIGNGSINDL